MTTLNSRLQLALLNRKKDRNPLEEGFTLVELMIVIVIVGILSAVALPNFLSQTSKAKATECTTRLGAILSQAGAEGLGTDIDTAAATMESIAEQHNSDLCSFTSSGYAEGTDIYTASVVGTDALSDKYNANGCVNPSSGERDIQISTTATTAADADCT